MTLHGLLLARTGIASSRWEAVFLEDAVYRLDVWYGEGGGH
jgi:hypothetical protein